MGTLQIISIKVEKAVDSPGNSLYTFSHRNGIDATHYGA
jgi:hypothetical protein